MKHHPMLTKLTATVAIFAILVFAIAPVSATAQTIAPSAADLRGIYIYTNDISQLTNGSAVELASSLGVSGVDGVNLVFGWDSIEPRQGVYQWDATNGLAWSNSTTYSTGEEVSLNSVVYASLIDGNLNNSPIPSKGIWATGTSYSLGDVVSYNSDIYLSLSNGNVGNQPVPGCNGTCTSWQPLWNPVGHDKNLLDHWIATAVSLNKKIALTVPAGGSIPSWLYQATAGGSGATPLNFTISPHAGATGVCDPITIAAPWDPVFLSQWDTMLSALATHLKTTFIGGVSEYDYIESLRLTGINRTTEELRLPAETSETTGLPCVSNAIKTWRKAGYTPALLLEGWNSILDSFIRSFPDKSFSIAIIPNGAFPPINDKGRVITGAVPDQNWPLLKSASLKLPGHLIVQFDFLLPGDAPSIEVIHAAHSLGTLAAFQTNEWLGGLGAACTGQIGDPSNPPMPCASSADFLTLLNIGVYPKGQTALLRSQYIEVFRANAIAFPDAILQAHQELITAPFVTLSFPGPPAGSGSTGTTIIGSVTASSAIGNPITKITCKHAIAVDPVGLGTPNAMAVVNVTLGASTVHVKCVATDSEGNKGESANVPIGGP